MHNKPIQKRDLAAAQRGLIVQRVLVDGWTPEKADARGSNMKRKLLLAGVAVLTASLVSAGDTKAPPKHSDEVSGHGLMVKRSELVQKKPNSDLGPARIWVVERKDDVQCLFVEVSGTIPMHFHPDGVHRMYVIEGKLRMTIGTETMDMETGDFMMIPRGVRHRVQRVGDAKAYFATVDTPPVDPKKIVWLETAPKK